MCEEPVKDKFHIVILGAGISGLSVAWHLKRLLGSCIRLTILEKNQRPGGWIHTLQNHGFLFEQGPRSFRTRGAEETLALIESLGLQDQIIFPHKNAKSRYLYQEFHPAKTNQRTHLQQLPKRFWEIPLHPLTRNCLSALWRDWKMPKRKDEDETIYSFFSRRFGIDWAENLIDPLTTGIYAGDARTLSMKSCFPLYDQWEQEQGSLLRGAWFHPPPLNQPSLLAKKLKGFPIFSFKDGMGILPNALAAELKEHLSLGATVKRLYFDSDGVNVESNCGKKVIAHHLISTVPTYALATLFPSDSLIAHELSTLQYNGVVIVNIGFHKPVLPFKGFGYLVPSKFNSQVLGCVWDSSIFPQHGAEGQTRLSLMLGGSKHPEALTLSDDILIDYAKQVMRQHMNITQEPAEIQIVRALKAIPQFEVGHTQWKIKLQSLALHSFPRLTISGTAWSGVSINDCIAHSYRIAKQLADQIEFIIQNLSFILQKNHSPL